MATAKVNCIDPTALGSNMVGAARH